MKRETRNKINNMEKKKYTAPAIEIIVLDNEISLALESAPPTYESNSLKQDNPFKPEISLF